MTMTEKKHAIKPYPLGAHVEDGAIRFAYASGKKDCGILIYDRKSGKKTHRVPFRQEERMGNVYCKYLELEPENTGAGRLYAREGFSRLGYDQMVTDF